MNYGILLGQGASRQSLKDHMLSNEALAVAGTLASVIGVVLAAASFVRRGRSRRIKVKVRTLRFWRSANFDLALYHLKDLIGRWQRHDYDTDSRRGFVTEYDLIRWIIQLALTCAANIAPQSVGKASLFRIGQIHTDDGRLVKVRVYSFELDGIFSAHQMIDRMNRKQMRDLSIAPENQSSDTYPAALQCVDRKEMTLQSLRQRGAKSDRPERELGLTHILAIPLRDDLTDAEEDQPVSITVDLRYAKPVAYLVDHTGLHRARLLERAEQLAETLSVVKDALQHSKFLPPPAPERGS